MKKAILFLIVIFFSFNAAHCKVLVKSLGGAIISQNQISTPIQVIEDSFISLRFFIKVRALDSYIVNTANPKYKIPISQLYVSDNENEFQMQANSQITLFSAYNLQLYGYTKNYNCIVKNTSVLPPGTYSTRLQFQTQTMFLNYTTVYNLTFTIPLNQEISSNANSVYIKLTPENVFEQGVSVANVASPQILIKSNDNWKLIMDTSNLGNLIGKYYFQITGASKNVSEYETSQTEILPNRQYVLAKGKPTVTDAIGGNYTTDFINIKYTLKDTSEKYLKEGQFKNCINYIIQRGDN